MNNRAAPAGRMGQPGRPPRNPGRWLGASGDGPSRLLVLLFVLNLAAMGAALTSRAAWPTRPLPETRDAVAMVSTALPGAEVRPKARPHAPFDYQPPLTDPTDKVIVPWLGGDGYEYSVVELAVGPVADPARSFEEARVRLARAGWDVRPTNQDPYGQRFTARTATTVISLGIATQVGPQGLMAGTFDPTIEAQVGNPPSASMRAPVLLGWLAGGLIGWVVALLAVRRLGADTGSRRTRLRALLILSVLLATPVALAGVFVEALYVLGFQPSLLDPVAPWLPYMLIYLRTPALLGAVLFCVTSAFRLVRRNP